MDFNIFLLRFGLDPNNFENKLVEPELIKDGFIYRVEQRNDLRECPFCHETATHIHAYDYVKYRCSENEHTREIIEIKKPRFYCPTCHKTFSNSLKGIERKTSITTKVSNLIMLDFTELFTFQQIADRYHLTQERVIQLFDEKVPFVPRRKMPNYLCIDEIKFSDDPDQKYACILSDYKTGEIIDVLKNRQLAYLNEYFSKITLKERENTKIFISDMYDAYASVCRKYFPAATHVIDLFHIILQMTNAVNTLRTRAMNLYVKKGCLGYNFMKQHWKYFLCRSEDIPDRNYIYKKNFQEYHYDQIINICIKKEEKLWTSYNILQDLYHYEKFDSFDDALRFIEWISNKLLTSDSDILQSVGRTYHKWRFEIANTFSNIFSGRKLYSNGMAEGNNNFIASLIKISYGCQNSERFRKRILLMKSYSKKAKES